MSSIPATCQVALPLPTEEPYSYKIPVALADRVFPGVRVVVPVRNRTMVGIVVALDQTDRDPAGLKSVLLAPDDEAMVPSALIELAGWISRYYVVPIGQALKGMIPGALWGTSRLGVRQLNEKNAAGGVSRDVMNMLMRSGGFRTDVQIRKKMGRPIWDVLQRLQRSGAVSLETLPPDLGPRAGTMQVLKLVKALPSLMERDEVFKRAKRQRELYEALDSSDGEMSLHVAVHEMGFSHALAKGLVERGLAVIEEREKLKDPFEGVSVAPPKNLSPEQRSAVEQISSLKDGAAALLFGVTGSGKTLVYLEAMRELVENGAGAIVLVPEIALTPQTIARVRGVFSDAVAVLHSGLSDAERADAWRAVVKGQKRVVVGARSAVFAPVKNLAMLVVDEEHDGSYKQGQTPRYHARDVAFKRANAEGAKLILGSATPSLETWSMRDRLAVIRLPKRVTEQELPPVVLVDLRSQPTVRNAKAVQWTEQLDRAVEDRLDRKEQVLLLLNRRGFAHFVQCKDCGQAAECPSCSIALTVHRSPERLRCHYCGFDSQLVNSCDGCGGETQRWRGAGTQQLETWLAERFPDARLARLDADTTSTKWSFQKTLDAVAAGSVDILLGTQMISKGLDFPNVTLVGVIDADLGLHLPDFRAAERTFQLVAQVAGRAGRGPKGGEVLVQTRMPGHYALQAAAGHDFEMFAERELAEREAPPYPPHRGLVNVTVSALKEMDAADGASRLADWFRALAEKTNSAVEIVGPAPAPLVRIQDRWRWHFVLRALDRALLGRVLRLAKTHPSVPSMRSVRVSYDRDPVSLL